jgi:hypothetical protein
MHGLRPSRLPGLGSRLGGLVSLVIATVGLISSLLIALPVHRTVVSRPARQRQGLSGVASVAPAVVMMLKARIPDRPPALDSPEGRDGAGWVGWEGRSQRPLWVEAV